MPIGNAEQRQEQRRLHQVDYQARYRAETKRQADKWELEQFMKAQRTRWQRRLQLGFWSDCGRQICGGRRRRDDAREVYAVRS